MKKPSVGDIVTGTVVRVYPTYAILLFDEGWTGLLHISELSNSFIHNFTSFVNAGSIYSVKVLSVSDDGNNVRVSLKAMTPQDKRRAFHHKRIDPEEIDFTALKEHLTLWIEQENASD